MYRLTLHYRIIVKKWLLVVWPICKSEALIRLIRGKKDMSRIEKEDKSIMINSSFPSSTDHFAFGICIFVYMYSFTELCVRFYKHRPCNFI